MREKSCKTIVEDRTIFHATPPEETFKVFSLQNICISFVAENIEHVDSLVGFPQVVGQALFSAVEKCGHLYLSSPQCGVIIQLFLDAYHATVLEHLSLQCAHLLINEHCDFWQRFIHLHVLDLGGSHLGDGHEMLSFVGLLRCLKCLSFRDNDLSDDGVRKFTCPSRVLAHGPSNLHVLDLSANPLLTNDAVRYLLHFEMLQVLDLSGTMVLKRGIKKLEEKLLLVVDEAATRDIEKTFSGECVGWAANVITRSIDTLPCTPSEDNNKTAIAKFYGRSKQRIALAQTLATCKPSSRHPVMCLRKSKPKGEVQQRQLPGTASLSSEQHSSGARKQHELSEDDMALMASYIV